MNEAKDILKHIFDDNDGRTGDIHPNDSFTPTYIPEFTTAEEFIDAKIKMLREDFCIDLIDEDIAYLRQFKTEIQINNAIKSIINRYWG